METASILSERNVVKFLLFLYDGPRGENEFKVLASNFYTIKATLEMLIREGLVEYVETDRKGRYYGLTGIGSEITSFLDSACDVGRPGEVRIRYSYDDVLVMTNKRPR